MRPLIAAFLLVLGLAPAAEALSVRDLIELSRAGLGDEVLLALIEVNRGVYAIDSATLISLKAAGVSDRVIAALVRSGREQPQMEPVHESADPPVEAAAPLTPQIVVVEHDAAPEVVAVPVAVPVYVAAPARRHRHVPASVESTFVPFQSGPPAAKPRTHRTTSRPVYWGFGGKLRPDAWTPFRTKADAQKRDSDKPRPGRSDKDASGRDAKGKADDSDGARKDQRTGARSAGQSPRN